MMSVPARLISCVACVLLSAAAARAADSELPSKSEVVTVMRLAADYAQRRYAPDVEAYWDDGVYHIGMLALHDTTQSSGALAYTERFGQYNGWILNRDGAAANRHNRLAAAQA